MSRKPTHTALDRRQFFTAVAATSAASAVPQPGIAATSAALPVRSVAAPSAALLAADVGTPPVDLSTLKTGCGSDFMLDVIKSLHIDYVFSNPGSSFLGLHESIVNYGANKGPEYITCMHEESAVAMANGYYKAMGRPAATLSHSTVGLQHAAMALYNAWCDRVPVINLLGNTLDLTKRTGANDWRHSAQDPIAMVRDFIKWDDQPTTLQGFAESLVHGYKIACTPPMEPIAIVADSELQEFEIGDRSALTIPRYTPNLPPVGDPGALREVARLLAAAERPVILVDRLVRSAEGMLRLVALAESVNAPVIDLGSRQNMPTAHYLCQTGDGRSLIGQADLILGLEVTDFWGQINQFNRITKVSHAAADPAARLITIGLNDVYLKSNYQDFQRYAPVDIAISGDGEATLPALLEAVGLALTNQRRRALAARGASFRESHRQSFATARQAAAVGWDASPVSTARMCMELWNAIRAEDWALVSVGASEAFISNWPHRLWNFDRHYRYLGYGAGGGVGYGLPAAVGAALANKALGRFSVNIQCDGDFMYANGALWTAAHHRIPLLTVMHNNRAYGQEAMLIQSLSNRRNRGMSRANIGTEINDPPINYAKLADGMGVWSAGPITDPAELAPALRRAVEVVNQGQPALVDVVTQTR